LKTLQHAAGNALAVEVQGGLANQRKGDRTSFTSVAGEGRCPQKAVTLTGCPLQIQRESEGSKW